MAVLMEEAQTENAKVHARLPTVGPHLLERALALGTVLGIAVQGFGGSLRITGAVSMVATIFALAWHKYLARTDIVKRGRSTARFNAPWLISIAMIAMLAGVFLRQYHVDKFSLDVGETAESFNFKTWTCWGQESCVARAITRLALALNRPSDLLYDKFSTDVELGSILRSSSESMDILHRSYGIDDKFLGTGLAVPVGKEEYPSARLPEYLIPNYPTTRSNILVWKLDPPIKYEKLSLSEVLKSVEPSEGQAATRKMMQEHLGLAESEPAVVRFAQLSDTEYKGCLARKERREVFASHLGFIINQKLSLGDAADLSGYVLSKPTKGESEKKFYIFVFVPSSRDELHIPTWRYVASHVENGIGNPSDCSVAAGNTM
jgi:hypothetical protein